MSAEQDEWNRAAAAGRVHSRRALLRVSLIVGAALAVAAGVVGFFYWDAIGSKKKVGEHCSATSECASGHACFEAECTEKCETDVRCTPGRQCVQVPVSSFGPTGVRSGGIVPLCVRDEDAPRLHELYKSQFH